jgi:L-fuconolactonase
VIVDAHQHFWDLETGDYPWLTPELGVLHRTYAPADLAPELAAVGVDRTVLVQAADSMAETESMLALADAHEFIAGVVGWLPLTDPDRTAEALADRHPKFVGVRHLIHDEPDPDWLLQDTVLASLGLLAEAGLAFDVVSLLPRHLEHVATIADRHPGLRLVVDHLSKPPVKDGGWRPWAELLAAAAAFPNVYAKVSGLVTEADHATWTPADLRPYVEYALRVFGTERLMFGSDWPVALLAADYRTVFETASLLVGEQGRDDVFGGTAARFYGF